MRKVKLKNVKELYDGSGQVLKPKITPVSKGGCHIQGPVDEIDSIDQLNTVSFGAEKRLGSRHFSSNKFHMKEESGTRHVCSTPCSSFMHAEQVASLMGTKVDDEFSDEACQGKAASRWFSNDADLSSPSRSSACNGGYHTSSEISNLLSACSSYDYFSENAESKATATASKIEMLVEVDTRQTVVDSLGFPEAPISRNDRIFSNQLEKQEKSHHLGNTISCISGSENLNMMVGDYNSDMDKKNASCSSASDISFPATEMTFNDQPASSCLAHFGKVDKFTKDCFQATVVYSNKSELSEISSTKDFYVGTCSLKGEPSACSDEQVESSLKKTPTFGSGGQIQDAEIVKPATEKIVGDLSAETAKCLDEMELFGKSNMVVDELNKQEPSLQLQPVNSGDGLDIAEDEVKVCDICGDAGREELLAICSKCSDGAEHTYCMRVKLDKIPKGNWMCEECVLREESEKQKPEKFEKVARVSQASSLKDTKQNSRISGALNYKKSLELDIKGSGVEKSRINRDRYTPHFSAKRPVSSLEAVSVTKRRAFEKSFKSSRVSAHCSKDLMCGDSSLKNLGKGKIKPANEVTSCDHSSNSTLLKAQILTTAGDKSPKLQPQYSMSRGSLMKSQSFNSMDSRKKFQLSEEGGAQKQNFSREASTSENKREGVARLCKSMSFNNASSDRINATDLKHTRLSSNLSRVKGLKRLRHAKDCGLIETTHGPTLKNPLVGSLAADSGVFASMAGKNITPGETILPLCSGSRDHDLKDDQGHVKSINLSKSTSRSRGSLNEEQNGIVNDVKQHAVYSTGGAYTIKENNSNATSHSVETPLHRDLPWFASVVAIPSWVSAVPQVDSIWKGEFEIQRSGKLRSSCHGFQAHLSTCASPKVLEVVNKLPQKILLEEVSCFRTWPTQFLENQATEDNIALYFFAKDLESYERHYKSLSDSMIQNDLALKGNIDGVELLVFTSNLLPEKSRCWNNLLYLWGVFRGRRVNSSDHIPSLQRRICLSSCSEQDLNVPTMSGPQNVSSSNLSSESVCASNICYSAPQTPNPSTSLELPPVTSGRIFECCEAKVSSPEQKSTNFEQRLSRVDTPMKSEKLSRNVPHTDSSQRERYSKRRQAIDLNCSEVGVDEERKCKRMKSIFSGDAKDLEGRFPFGTNGLNPRSSGEDPRCGGTSDSSINSANQGSVDGSVGLKSLQLSTYGEDWLQAGVPNLDLSLGVGKDSTIHGVMSPWMGIMDSENNQDKCSKLVRSKKNSNEDIDGPSTPLSLSLALPFSNEKQVAKPDSETKLLLPEWCGVNTSLSL